MKILITGVTSFIGQYLLQDLISCDHHIVATYRTESNVLSRFKSKLSNLPKGGFDLIKIDLADSNSCRLLPSDIDIIIHVAGVSKTPQTSNQEILNCNVLGLSNLLEFIRSSAHIRVIYMSSLSVYGKINEQEVDEKTPVRDPDIYGVSKLIGERLFAETNIPTVALRLPGVLGIGAHRAFLPTLFECVTSNKDLTIYNPRALFNNAVHISDIQGFIRNLIRKNWSGFHAFPLGAKNYISIIDIARQMIIKTHSRSNIIEVDSSSHSFTINSDYAQKSFGYQPDSIQSIINMYIEENLSV